MSCVVGVVSEGKVWMGAVSEDMLSLVNRKIFFNGPLLIGCVGSIRMTQLIQYKLFVPEPPSMVVGDRDLMRYMAISFVDAVRKVFQANDFSLIHDDHSTEGVSLIGYRGHLFRMEGDLQIVERVDGYEAIGCGSPYALGSLFESGKETPFMRVTNALTASHHFSAHVRPPYKIMSGDDIGK
jgi:hypothetical protein